MSSFVVAEKVVIALATYGDRHDRLPEGYTAAQAAQELMDENQRSVNWRYKESTPSPKVAYYFKPLLGKDAALRILRLCDYYEYQAVDTGHFSETVAGKIIERIRRFAITELPGYSNLGGDDLY